LNEWPENDYRIFVGDLGNEVTTDNLAREFQCYPSFAKAKVVLHCRGYPPNFFQVIREGWNDKSKGYGFVSFLDPFDCAKAIREKHGKYLGYR
jgi:RNA recognition motif-containing protein